MAHLGILTHSPMLARHSPGKLHLLRLAEHLLGEGTDVLDLTPGRDPWKERFANEHDNVAEVVFHSSVLGRVRVDAVERLSASSRRFAAMSGVRPTKARLWLGG